MKNKFLNKHNFILAHVDLSSVNKSKISNFFPPKAGWDKNPIMRLFYIFSIPFTKLLLLSKLKPDIISYLSLIITIFGCVAFFFDYIFFILLLLLGLIFDLSDGTIARFYQLQKNSIFRLDHTLDIIKILFITIVYAINYYEIQITILLFCFSNLFLLFTYFNNQLVGNSFFESSNNITRTSRSRIIFHNSISFDVPSFFVLIIASSNLILFYTYFFFYILYFVVQTYKIIKILNSPADKLSRLII